MTPAIYETVLLSFGGEARGVVVKGIDVALERRSDEALQKLSAGRLDFSPDADGIDGLLVGKQLAEEWKLQPGDYVTLTSPQGRLTPFGLMPRTRRFRVAGVFDSGFYDYDENWCFVTLPAAQSLAGTGDVVNVLEFRLTKPEQAGEIASEVEHAAGRGFTTTTWMEENRALFRALRLEKLVTAIFIGLITFVAGLNILVVLSMTVTDKARDIAVLLSDGNAPGTGAAHFFLAGDGDWRDRDGTRPDWRLCVHLDRRKLSLDSARPAGVRRALCTVSSQFSGRIVDCSSGYGDCDAGHGDPGA